MNEVTKVDPPRSEVADHRPADPMVSMIERVVMNPDADLDKLERMLAMKERMDAQNARVAFARALSMARAEMPPIIKDATVDFTSQKGRTHYKHETLAGIAKQIDPILSEHGLSYRFRTDQSNGGIRVTCIVQHSDGHCEETSLAGAPDQSGSKNNFQAVGSAVTYLQRYTLKAALGLSAEVDDDAQSAGNGSRRGTATISSEQYIELRNQAHAAGVDEKDLCRFYDAASLEQFPRDKFDSAMKKIRKTIDVKKAANEARAKPTTGEIIGDEIPY